MKRLLALAILFLSTAHAQTQPVLFSHDIVAPLAVDKVPGQSIFYTQPKFVWGALGTFNQVSSSTPLPVTVTSLDPTIQGLTVTVKNPITSVIVNQGTVPWISSVTNLVNATLVGASVTVSNQVTAASSAQDNFLARSYSGGLTPVSTFTQNYASTNLTTGTYIAISSSVPATVNSIDIFDTSGLDYYLSYAATCSTLTSVTNSIIVSAGGGQKDLRVPSGNCIGFEAKTSITTAGSVNMTLYK